MIITESRGESGLVHMSCRWTLSPFRSSEHLSYHIIAGLATNTWKLTHYSRKNQHLAHTVPLHAYSWEFVFFSALHCMLFVLAKLYITSKTYYKCLASPVVCASCETCVSFAWLLILALCMTEGISECATMEACFAKTVDFRKPFSIWMWLEALIPIFQNLMQIFSHFSDSGDKRSLRPLHYQLYGKLLQSRDISHWYLIVWAAVSTLCYNCWVWQLNFRWKPCWESVSKTFAARKVISFLLSDFDDVPCQRHRPAFCGLGSCLWMGHILPSFSFIWSLPFARETNGLAGSH